MADAVTTHKSTLKEFADTFGGTIMVSSVPGAYTIYRGPSSELPKVLHSRILLGVHGPLCPTGHNTATRLWTSVSEEELRMLRHGCSIY